MQVKAVEVHHLVRYGHDVPKERLFRVVRDVEVTDRSEL